MSSDRLVRIAIRPCLPTRLKRVFAPTSAHFVRRASKTSWRTCARTAAGDSFQGPSDQRRTGKATTSLARIPRAPRSGISRLTWKFMLGSRPQSKPYPLTSARARLNRRAQPVVAVAGLCGALFAFADPTISPAAGNHCEYPGLGITPNPNFGTSLCQLFGFRVTPIPAMLVRVPVRAGGRVVSPGR